jgi:DNA-binding transcriptional ArsR family regulator
VLDLQVIGEPRVAAAVLDPLRARILAALRQPGSASSLAVTLGESRQKVNYHVRSLEQHGLVRLAEQRPRRGLTERVMVASARSYVLSPAALGAIAADPARTDRWSTRYLIALAARMVREVADLATKADEAGRPLATMALDAEIRFASAADRRAFTDELTGAVASLIAKYHDQGAPGGRWHRLVVAAHARPPGERAATQEAPG